MFIETFLGIQSSKQVILIKNKGYLDFLKDKIKIVPPNSTKTAPQFITPKHRKNPQTKLIINSIHVPLLHF